jgi:hypothetical protein
MMNLFFNIDGIVHQEFIPQEQIVYQHFCTEVFHCLQEDMQ